MMQWLYSISPWWFLSIAIFLEVCGSTCMKLSDGFRNLSPTMLMFAFYACAFACNAMAVRKLDLSVTYAIWSGVGTAATALIGFMFFKEPVTTLRVAGLFLIIAGVAALRFSVPAAKM
jgi:small multidrug resistance pump